SIVKPFPARGTIIAVGTSEAVLMVERPTGYTVRTAAALIGPDGPLVAAPERVCNNSAMAGLDSSAPELTWDQRIFQLVDPGVDGTLIAENLRRTPTERLRRMQDMTRFFEDARCDRRPATP